jgi:mono/diheme cytochrome c family protein
MITKDKGNQRMKTKKLIILVSVLALTLAACGGGSSDGGGSDTVAPPSGGAGDAVAGADIYKATCTACHGSDLAGIDGLGLPLAPSDFVTSQSEADLAAFISRGRPTSDPDSTSGVDMPPRGGNPSLDEQDLLDVSAYLLAQN